MRRFQRAHGLRVDGDPGPKTWRVVVAELARADGYFPSKPPFRPLTQAQKKRRFGDPTKGVTFAADATRFQPNREWKRGNIVAIPRQYLPESMHAVLPQKVWLHRDAVNQFHPLLRDWDRAGLAPLILSWNGSIAFRRVRGGRRLSSHAFGTAFDVNTRYNRLGAQPAPVGAKGSVLELVKIANANGWYWGGHFSRPDGMHFELAA